MSFLGEVFWVKSKQGLTADPTTLPVVKILSVIVYIGFGVSILLMAAGLAGKLMLFTDSKDIYDAASFFLGIGAVGISICLLMAEYLVWFNDWIANNKIALTRAFFNRDLRGRRLPRLTLRESLDLTAKLHANSQNKSSRLRDYNGPLDSLPDEMLLAVMASRATDKLESAVLKTLGAPDAHNLLRARPHCTVLTKIDFAENIDSSVRTLAVDLLPRSLWHRAINSLFESKYTEPRIAAVSCSNIPREMLLKACSLDRSIDVRKTACEQAATHLSARESESLCHSSYPDVRLFAIRSSLLPSGLLVRLCGRDENQSVRRAAWEAIEKNLSNQQATTLLRSAYGDTRLRAVQSDRLHRNQIVRACRDDKERSVRAAALGIIKARLTRYEAAILSRSNHPEISKFAVESGRLSRWQLFRLSLTGDKEMRKAARRQRRPPKPPN